MLILVRVFFKCVKFGKCVVIIVFMYKCWFFLVVLIISLSFMLFVVEGFLFKMCLFVFKYIIV